MQVSVNVRIRAESWAQSPQLIDESCSFVNSHDFSF